jgi:hypothetical protein
MAQKETGKLGGSYCGAAGDVHVIHLMAPLLIKLIWRERNALLTAASNTQLSRRP